MSSSQDSDIDLECQRVIKPKKFKARLIGSIQIDDVSTRSDNLSDICPRYKKYEKIEDKNTQNSVNKYARRLPIAFNILNQGITSLNSNFKKQNQNSSLIQRENSDSISDSTEKVVQKMVGLKRFQQDICKLEKNHSQFYESIQKVKIKKLTQTMPRGKNLLNEQISVNQVSLHQKTTPIFTPNYRNRSQIIKELDIGGNKIRTNWQKGVINGYTQIDYKDQGKFRGIFQQGQMSSGEMTFPNDFIYTGEFSFYKFHGVGKLKFPSGQIFEGNWFFGSLNGKAKVFYPQGQFYYGHVSNFKRQGQGYLYFQNGDKYVGQFLKGEITGFGELHKKGQCANKGFWVDGKFVGNQQAVYLKKKEERQNKKSKKKQKKQNISLDIQSSLKEIKNIHQLINLNKENENCFYKAKIAVSFNQELNVEFIDKSKQLMQQQYSQQSQGWDSLLKKTSISLQVL